MKSETGIVKLQLTATGHSHRCDCDPNMWYCVGSNDTVDTYTPMSLVARFTFTENGIPPFLFLISRVLVGQKKLPVVEMSEY